MPARRAPSSSARAQPRATTGALGRSRFRQWSYPGRVAVPTMAPGTVRIPETIPSITHGVQSA